MANKKKNWIAFMILIILMAVGYYFFLGARLTNENKIDTQTSSIPRNTNYVIVDRNLTDTPGKTQVELSAVITGDIDEYTLKETIQFLYEEAINTRGFKHKGGLPTNIYVYIYQSKVHFNAQSGQWIAMMSSAQGSQPEMRIQREFLRFVNAEPEERFGLTEIERKEIFAAALMAEDRAYRNAQQQYPDDFSAENKRANELYEQYLIQLAEDCGITLEILNSIRLEALEKNWLLR